jgi:hypothetical protein
VLDEGPRRGAPGNRVQQRRLDLDEAEIPQTPAHVAHHIAPQLQDLAAALVGPQVDLALAVPRLGVRDPAPLVAEVATRLRQEHPLGHLDRQLAPLGAHDLAPGPHPVAEVQPRELVEACCPVLRREQLNGARVVAQLGEGELALGPRQHDAAGHRHRGAGLLAGGERRPPGDHLGRVVRAIEPVGDLGAAHAPLMRRSCAAHVSFTRRRCARTRCAGRAGSARAPRAQSCPNTAR